MTNKNTIKKLLAAASTVAILASGSSALATTYVVGATPAQTNAALANTLYTAGAVVAANGNTADVANTFIIGQANTALTLNAAAAAANVQTLNLYGFGGTTVTSSVADLSLTITNDTTVGAVALEARGAAVAPGAAANIKLDLTLTENLNLAGGSVLLGNATNAGTVALANKVLTVVEDVSSFTNVTFTGAVGSKLSFTGTNSTLTDVTVAAGFADLAVATTKTVTLAGTTDLSNLATGTTLTGTGALVLGTGTNGGKILAAADGNGAVSASGNVTITQLGDAGGNALTSLTFTDDATATIGGAGAGKVNTLTTAAGKTSTNTLMSDLTVGKVVGDAPANTNFVFGATGLTLTVSGAALNSTVSTSTAFANRGTLVLNNGAAVTVAGTGTIAGLNTVAVSAAGTAVDFGTSLTGIENIDFAGAGNGRSIKIASFGSAPTLNNFTTIDNSGNDNAAAVTLTNADAVTLRSIGANNAIVTFTLNGAGNVTVAPAGLNKITNLVFDTAAAGTTFTVNDIATVGAAGSITTKSASNGGTLSFLTGGALQANFGNTGNTLTALNYAGTAVGALDVNNKNLFGANITATTDAKLTVTKIGTNAGADQSVGTIGSSTAKMVAIEFAGAGAANTLTVGDIWTASAKLVNASKYAFSNVTGVKDANGNNATFSLNNANSTVTFTNSTITNTDIVTGGAGVGTIVFDGNTTVGKVGTDVAAAASITFTGTGKAVTLNDSIYSNANTFAQSTYTATTDLTIGGATNTVDGTTFVVGSGKTLEFANDIANATTKANKGLVLTLASDKTGVTAKVTGAAVNNVENITVNIENTYGAAGTTADVVTFTGIGANAAKVNVSSISDLFKYTIVKGTTDNKISIVATQDVTSFANVLGAFGANADGQSVVKLLENSTGNADAFLELLDTVADNKTAAEAVNRMAARSNTSTHAKAVSSDNQDTFAQRLNIVSSATGVSSGTENSMMNLGVWGHVNGSKTTQKAKKTDSGFTANGTGLTVGVDTKLADMTTIGIAATQSSSTLKFKNTKSGDKAKSANTFFNLYARHDLADAWFIQGIAGFGSGSIKATDKRIATNTGSYDTATAKYDTMSYSLDVTTGYAYKVADTTSLVPTVGLRYISVNEGGYTETGSAFNRTVTKKASDVLSGVFGGYVKQDVDMSGTTALVEAHAFGNYDFTNKNAKISAKLDGMSGSFDISPSKQNKFSYNLGVSANARVDMVEYGIGYDAKLADKFVSHQGTLRLRVDL